MPVFHVFGRDVANDADPRTAHHAAPLDAPVVDFSTVSTCATFGDLLETVSMINEDEGVRVWLPHKILALPGLLASSLDTDKLLQVCLDCVGSAKAECPPLMTAITIEAAVAGGSQPSILLRTQRALMQATVEFLWRAIDHGGMMLASGLVVLPTARRGPSAWYGGSAPAEHRHPASPMPHRESWDNPSARYSGSASAERRQPAYPLYRRTAPNSGSQSATKRSWVDNDEDESATRRSWVDDDERGDKRMKSSSSWGPGPLELRATGVRGKEGSGGGATGPPPRMRVTVVTIPEQVRG